MPDDEWRDRTIRAALQAGRPVFADSDGNMRYLDGDREHLDGSAGIRRAPLPKATTIEPSWWSRLWRKLTRSGK